jgi:centractin
VYEGFTIPPAIRRIDIAGRDVTEHLQLLLRKAGATFHTSAEKEIVRTIKEKMCYVAEDPRKEEKEWGGVPGSGSGGLHNKGQEYKLPDGRSIKVCYPNNRNSRKLGAERFRATEILFNPEIIGSEYQGVHEMLFDSINRTDLDLRRNLFGTIVLSGGTTLSKGKPSSIISNCRFRSTGQE